MLKALRLPVMLALLVAALAVPSAAAADERVLQFRSQEDPTLSGDTAACPYESPNLRLRARAEGYDLQGRTGVVTVDADPPLLGTIFACGVITDFLFSPGSEALFYAEFNLSDGTYAAEGTCRITSNTVPVPRVILAGCSLRLVAAPDPVGGGIATSNSVFNPFRLPGFDTGSYWTIRGYTDS
jgi:hypothetical protein